MSELKATVVNTLLACRASDPSWAWDSIDRFPGRRNSDPIGRSGAAQFWNSNAALPDPGLSRLCRWLIELPVTLYTCPSFPPISPSLFRADAGKLPPIR